MGTQAGVWDEGGARRLACAPWELAWPGRWCGPRGEEERPAALPNGACCPAPTCPAWAAGRPSPGSAWASPGAPRFGLRACFQLVPAAPGPALPKPRPPSGEKGRRFSGRGPLPCSSSGTEGPKGGRLRQSGAGTSAGDLPPPLPRATPLVPAPLFWRVLVLAETFHIQELTHSPNEQSCFLPCAVL